MAKRIRYSPEQIITNLREVEKGIQHDQAAQRIGVSSSSSRNDLGSLYPILSTCTNIRSGTNNGGTSPKGARLAGEISKLPQK